MTDVPLASALDLRLPFGRGLLLKWWRDNASPDVYLCLPPLEKFKTYTVLAEPEDLKLLFLREYKIEHAEAWFCGKRKVVGPRPTIVT